MNQPVHLLIFKFSTFPASFNNFSGNTRGGVGFFVKLFFYLKNPHNSAMHDGIAYHLRAYIRSINPHKSKPYLHFWNLGDCFVSKIEKLRFSVLKLWKVPIWGYDDFLNINFGYQLDFFLSHKNL
jgi:hypothetical protein